MSKLQKYLKTPKLKDIHFLSFPEDQFDHPNQVQNLQHQTPGVIQLKEEEAQIRHFQNAAYNMQRQRIHGSQMEQEHPVRSVRKQISGVLKFQDEQCQEIIGTPEKKDKRLQLWHTTASKRYQLRATLSERFHKYDLKDHEWTLKNLARLAYDAVIEMGPTNYKQVAQHIIHEKAQLSGFIDSKEKCNIKRRVYDALNVLIALGKLEKKGRKILKDPKKFEFELQRQAKKVLFENQVNVQNSKIVQLKKIIQLRRSCLTNLNLTVDRNQSQQYSNIDEEKKIRFPVLAISATSLPGFEMSKGHLTIKSNKDQELNLMGDLECLAMMPPQCFK